MTKMQVSDSILSNIQTGKNMNLVLLRKIFYTLCSFVVKKIIKQINCLSCCKNLMNIIVLK